MQTTTAPTYAADGVDLEAGDTFSSFAGRICRSTYGSSPFVTVNDRSRGLFRGPRTCRLKNLSPECEFSLEPDGGGTKPIITTAALAHRFAGHDLFAMTGMDSVRYGGKPLVLVNQLDVATLGRPGEETFQCFCRMMAGLGDVARNQGVILLKGETAEMSVCVESEDPQSKTKFNWCGVMYSVFHEEVLITGNQIQLGHFVMALSDSGLRANGGSTARKAFALKFGPEWWKVEKAQGYIRDAATPSALFEAFLAHLNGWDSIECGVPRPVLKVMGIAHITGGGIPSKFFNDLLKPAGLSAELWDLPKPPAIMRNLAEWRGVSGKECYEIWHGGPGALVVIDPNHAARFLRIADEFGVRACTAGMITRESSPTLRIRSGFDGEMLIWS